MTHICAGACCRRAIARRRLLASLGALGLAIGARPAAADFVVPDIGSLFQGAASVFKGMSLNEEDEIEIGTGLYPRLIARSGGPYRNRGLQSSVERFAQPLIDQTKRRHLPWEIVVLDDNTVNAWALPGGKMAVNRGLLRYTASEEELAAVLSHEIGHVERSHALNQMRREEFNKGLTEVGKQAIASQAGAGAGSFVTGQVLDALEGPLGDMMAAGYSRELEDEADQHIFEVFGNVGYDPGLASSFFHTLVALIPNNAKGTTSLYSTHKGTEERIAAIEKMAKGLPKPAPRQPSPAFAEVKRVLPTPQFYRGPA